MGVQQIIDPLSPGTNSCPNCGSVNLGMRDSCTLCGADLPKFKASLSGGEIIHDKYEIVGLLGIGGMGEVYKVRHTTLDTIRCIKLMKQDLMSDESFTARFLREAKVATRVHHPNVAVVHDFDTTPDGTYYLVSEFIDGITVRQWSKRHGRFPVDLAIMLTDQVLSGLRHIHSQGLLHRDISADNIMITLDHDEEPLAKIIDLGIAKVVEGAAEVTQATATGIFVGNPKYASPEQLGLLAEGATIDRRADLYCLGVVLYEMILGVPPFVSKTPQGYVAKHLTEMPPRFAEIDNALSLPEGLEDVVFKALQKDREHRHQSAREFSRELRPFLALFDTDPIEYGTQIRGDLPSIQTEALLREVTPLPSTGEVLMPASDDLIPGTLEQRVTGTEEIDRGALDDAAWERVDAQGDLESYREYVEEFPAGRHAEQAQSRLEDLELVADIEDFERELNLFELERIAKEHSRHTPVGAAARDAVDRVGQLLADREREAEETDWERAMEARSTEEWTQYVRQHFDSPRVEEARRYLEESTAFDVASKLDSLDAWRAFAAQWEDGLHASEARARIDDLEARAAEEHSRREQEAWQSAEGSGTSVAWQAFLDEFPDSDLTPEAQNRLSEAKSFERADDQNSLDGWEAYLSKWPDGPHADPARRAHKAIVDQIESQRAQEEEAAWTRAEAKGTPAAWKKYLDSWSDSNRAARAQALLEEAEAFKRARDVDSLAEWDSFLERWPSGANSEKARSLRAELAKRIADQRLEAEMAAWTRAAAEATVSSWSRFLQEYPASAKAEEAHERLAEAEAFEQAEQIGDTGGWKKFKAAFPDGRLATVARERLEAAEKREASAAWESAFNAATIPEIESFLSSYPDSVEAEDARALLEELKAHDKASRTNEIEDWESYLSKWPSGRFIHEAEARIAAIREEVAFKEAVRHRTVHAFDSFLRDFPDGPHAEEATAYRRECKAWENAGNDVDAISAFLESFPQGLHQAAAEKALEQARQERDQKSLARIEFLEKEGNLDELEQLAAVANGAVKVSAQGAVDRLRKERMAAVEEEASAWTQADGAGTSTAWSDYVRSFPKSSRIDEARERLSEAEAYETAQERGELADWRKFVRRWPEGPHSSRARGFIQRLEKEEADFERASEARSSRAWATFLEKHPETPRAPMVKKLFEEARSFEAAMEKASIEQWNRFLADWPTGPYVNDAKRHLAECRKLEAERAEKERRALEEKMAAADEEKKRERDQRERERNASRATTIATPKTETPPASPETVRSDTPGTLLQNRRAVIVVAAIFVVVVLVTLVFRFRSTEEPEVQKPTPAVWVATGAPNLTVDAQPWARVTSIVSESGTEMLDGDQTTPIGLELPPGVYTIEIEMEGESRQSVVTIDGSETVGVVETFHSTDASSFFERTGW